MAGPLVLLIVTVARQPMVVCAGGGHPLVTGWLLNVHVTLAPGLRFAVSVRVARLTVVPLPAGRQTILLTVQPVTASSVTVRGTPADTLPNVFEFDNGLPFVPSSSRVAPVSPGPAIVKLNACELGGCETFFTIFSVAVPGATIPQQTVAW